MSNFVPGLQLSERYFTEVVRPILDKHFGDLTYSAALIGSGSEVLGYDTEQSSDHDWGPRVLIFLNDNDFKQYANEISTLVDKELPEQFLGYPTRYELRGDAKKHRVEVHTISSLWLKELAFNPNIEPTYLDWLTFPEQKLLSLTSGKVFWDGLGELEKARGKFAYYPNDMWLYILSAQWTRLAQEEAFMGRAGDVDDELGSQMIAAHLVRDIMQLCFLMERKYAPYSKWYGTAFQRLDCATNLSPLLRAPLLAERWKEREAALSKAYVFIAQMHNKLNITEPLEATVSSYYDRPYQVLHADRFSEAIRGTVKDKEIKGLTTQIGSVNQFADSTDLMEHPELTHRLKLLFE